MNAIYVMSTVMQYPGAVVKCQSCINGLQMQPIYHTQYYVYGQPKLGMLLHAYFLPQPFHVTPATR
jgi:hypothetical protein